MEATQLLNQDNFDCIVATNDILDFLSFIIEANKHHNLNSSIFAVIASQLSLIANTKDSDSRKILWEDLQKIVQKTEASILEKRHSMKF